MSLFPAYSELNEDTNQSEVVASTSKNIYVFIKKMIIFYMKVVSFQAHGLKMLVIHSKPLYLLKTILVKMKIITLAMILNLKSQEKNVIKKIPKKMKTATIIFLIETH